MNNAPKKPNGVMLDNAMNIMILAIEYLWKFYLAIGKFHLLVGDPGSGKTTFLAKLIAVFSYGGLLPDGTRAPRIVSIYWTGEDGIEDTVMPRLQAAGADMRNVFILRGVAEHGRKRFFRPTDLPALVQEIKRLRGLGLDVRLIAIDPLPSGSGNSHRNDDVRKSLEPLIALAEEEGIAIIGVRHLNKGSSKKKLADRINGSVAFLAVARVVMFVAKISGTGTSPDNPARGVLVRAKSNIGPTDGGFGFTVMPIGVEAENGVAETTALEWDEQAMDGDPEPIVRAAESGTVVANDLAAEIDFLRDLLLDGPVPSVEVLARGKSHGFTDEKLRAALTALGERPRKEPGSARGTWYWMLPGSGFDDRRERLRDDRYDDVLSRFDRHADAPRRRNSRDAGRFDDLPSAGTPKGEKDGQDDKVEKSANTAHGDMPRWTPNINLPEQDDDDSLDDEPVGV